MIFYYCRKSGFLWC